MCQLEVPVLRVFVCRNVRESQEAAGERERVCEWAWIDSRERRWGEKQHKEPRGEEECEGKE